MDANELDKKLEEIGKPYSMTSQDLKPEFAACKKENENATDIQLLGLVRKRLQTAFGFPETVPSEAPAITEKPQTAAIQLQVQETKRIDEGKHVGTITRVEKREASKAGRKFAYVDIFVKTGDAEIKAGYPARVTRESSLGRLVQRFGGALEVGQTIAIDPLLLNRACTFVTVNEKTDEGTFARIQRESLRPASEGVK